MADHNLRILGCGDAFATDGRFNTSFLLEGPDRSLLIDCGASTLVRLKQLGLTTKRIETIVITHFHGDHYGGIPFFVINAVVNKQAPEKLSIIGPEGVEDMVRNLQGALYPGSEKMIDDLKVTFTEFSKEWKGIGEMEISAIPVVHAPASNPHGVRFRWNNKILAFSGDTEWTENLIELADGSEIFIAECNNYRTDGPGHLSYNTLSERHKELNSNRILLSHMGQEMLDADDLSFGRLEDGMVILLW